ncbi:MAG: hypothetical protein ACLRFR_03320 [Clostridia bacterium]
MKNSIIVDSILEMMEKEHLNLYHSISKQEILEYKEKIDWDNLSSTEFDYQMSKIFAMFKDAHTTFALPRIRTNKKFWLINEKIYLRNNGKLEEIISINDICSNDLIDLAKNMTSWETEAWAKFKVEECLNNLYFYEMIGKKLNDKILCTTSNHEEICVSRLEKCSKVRTNQHPWYDYKIINDVLYVQYARCQDMQNYPFRHMVKEIAQEIENIGISAYILDVRGNTGGNSEILNPFQTLMAEKKLKGAVLIDYKTFSSGRWAVARFKKHLNATLIGEATGGSAKSYGNNKHLEFASKKFSVSTKFFDFSDIGYTQSFIPDIEIKPTIKDIENREDKALEVALKFLSANKTRSQELTNRI